MFPVGGLIKKAKAMIPKAVTAVAKTVVKKAVNNATNIINRFEKTTSAAKKAIASIPVKAKAMTNKAQAITQKVAAAVPKVVNAAKAAVQKQRNKIAEVNNVIKTTVLTKAVELNEKNLRILDAVKTEANTAVARIIKGSITLGAMPGYNATRNSASVLNFLLQTRNAIIKEYPILNLQHNILKTSLSFTEDQAKNLNDYVGSVASQANAPFISDYLVSLTGHRDPNAKSNGPSIQGAYDRGLYIKGMGGTIDAFANILADPYEALEGLNTIAMEPEIMVPAIAKIMIKHVDTKVIHGSAEDRVEFTSQAIFEVAQLFIGTGEIKLGTKVVALGKETLKAVEVIKYATKADKIIQIEKLLNSTIFKTLEKTLNATAKSAGGKAVDCIESLRIILRNNSKSMLPSYAGIGVIDNFVETSEMVQKYITKFKNMASDITNGKGINIEIKSNIKGIEEGAENAVKAFGEDSSKVTKPSGLPNPNAKPKGNYAPNDTPGYIRQNESADLLSQNGYKVEMLDEVPGGNGYGVKETSNPDLLIENKVYDSYAPKAETSIKTIVRELSGKTKNQAPNIVLNLDDYAGNLDELISVIKQKATPNGDLKRLEDLKIIKDGKIINILTD